MQQRYPLVLGVALLVWFFLGLAAAAETSLPSARIRFESTSIGVLVGFTRGTGTLNFRGEEYPFVIKGLSLFDVGGSKVDGVGVVYNLNDVGDFEGTYTAGEFGLTTIQGGTSMVMRNGNGVRLHVDTLQKGLELNLGGGGIRIELAGQVEAETDVESLEAKRVQSGEVDHEPTP